MIREDREQMEREMGRSLSEAEMKQVALPRATVGMRLSYMRAEHSIASELHSSTGAIRGTPGYRYGLPGPPPSGDPRVVAAQAELEQRAPELARAVSIENSDPRKHCMRRL